jgi:aminoglycoside 6-adenylyltransferase
MAESKESDVVLQALVQWSEERDAVRAMLLTSTRAVPGGQVDALSDYDVILIVREVGPLVTDRGWIETFGEVLVAYWDPIAPDPDTGIPCSGNIVQYVDGHKIDFTLWPGAQLERIAGLTELPAELDAGYRVLLDKDGLTAGLAAPTYTGYQLSPPDEETYLTLVNDFFIGVPYVAKCLLRDEILPAKWCLDYDMRYVYLLPMLEWWAACANGWRISPGVNGKGLRQYLSADIWADLKTTYAGADVEANGEALFRMISLFGRVGREVGAALRYSYPEELDARVTAFAQEMLDRAR